MWHFGMKAHIGADAESGLVHTLIGTAANVADIACAQQLLHLSLIHIWRDPSHALAADLLAELSSTGESL